MTGLDWFAAAFGITFGVLMGCVAALLCLVGGGIGLVFTVAFAAGMMEARENRLEGERALEAQRLRQQQEGWR